MWLEMNQKILLAAGWQVFSIHGGASTGSANPVDLSIARCVKRTGHFNCLTSDFCITLASNSNNTHRSTG